MNVRFKTAAVAILAGSLVVSCAYAGGQTPQAQKPAATRKTKTPPPPSVEEQIQELRQELQSQIDALKQELAGKDAQLRQAQQAAATAQAAADKAQAAATAQQQAVNENTSAVNTLQSNVNDLKTSSSSIRTSVEAVRKDATEIKQSVESPDAIHFKGITISPTGSFLAGETDWRSGATGGGLNTAFTGIPLQNSEDSDSYVVRVRQLWADAKLNNGWDFSGGQGWSLAAETTQGLTRGTEILPGTIDPQYNAGFVWARQYSFRVVKSFGDKFFAGISVENPQILNPSGQQNLPTNLFIGSTGTGGGLLNPTANYSFALTPDFIAKIAAQPGWGHWELFGIGRSFRDRIYPSSTYVASEAVCGASPCNNTVWGGGIGGGFRGPLANKKVSVGLKGLWGDGIGRYGTSAIADITIRPDGAISPLHDFSALSTVEWFPTPKWYIYVNYGGDYAGRDWQYDNVVGDANYGKEVGYGTPMADMGGCNTEPAPASSTAEGNSANVTPSNCVNNIKDVQEFTAGYWFKFTDGPTGSLRYGLQYSLIRRDLWSGANVGGAANNPDGGAHGDDNMVFTSFRYYLP